MNSKKSLTAPKTDATILSGIVDQPSVCGALNITEMELKKIESLKIEIVKQAQLNGSIYYNLYVNDSFQTLSSKREEIEDKAKQIEALFLAGEMDEQIVFSKELTR